MAPLPKVLIFGLLVGCTAEPPTGDEHLDECVRCVFYTEYVHVGFPEVQVGQSLLPGDTIGRLDDDGVLHFALGDGKKTPGDPRSLSGRTVDLSEHYGLPAIKTERDPRTEAGPPAATCAQAIARALAAPVASQCEDGWHEMFGAEDHGGDEFHAMDWYCPSDGDQDRTALATGDFIAEGRPRQSARAVIQNPVPRGVSTQVVPALLPNGTDLSPVGVVLLRHEANICDINNF